MVKMDDDEWSLGVEETDLLDLGNFIRQHLQALILFLSLFSAGLEVHLQQTRPMLWFLFFAAGVSCLFL